MGKFVIRRLLQMVLVLLGATLILFCCLFLFGNPVENLGGSDRARDPATVKLLEEKYGLNDNIIVQYGHYVQNVATGNLGESYRQRRPVNDILSARVGYTAGLAGLAIVIDIVIGLSAGIIAAIRRYSIADVGVTLITTLFIGLPVFVVGLMLQYVFGVKLQILPISGFNEGLKSYILPAFTLAIIDAALVARLMRGTMLEVLRADYIRTAVAKGLAPRVVIGKHAIRNSIIPVVTYLGISFGTLLGGALVTEAVFGLPGVGSALLVAIQTNDNPIVQGIVVYGVAVFVVLNLLVDVLYAFLDPRIRLE